MGRRVLIVEDEILVALELEAVLEDLGHEPVGIAADSLAALRLAEEEPDLALVDLNLRDGPTGAEIGARLARDHGVTVLFMTANPRMLGDGVAGTLGVLSKPYDEETVKAAVDYVIATQMAGGRQTGRDGTVRGPGRDGTALGPGRDGTTRGPGRDGTVRGPGRIAAPEALRLFAS